MAIDWQQLVRVRERSRTAAVDEARRDAEAVALRDAEVARAEAELEARRVSRQALWHGVAEPGRSGLRMDDLRGAASWGRRLDRQITEAGAGVEASRAEAARQQERLVESRARVRRAAAEVQRATEMGERVRAAQRRRQELRLEDLSEESALRVWATGRGKE
ncbi:MAG: hypothetical protein ABW067_19285 [Rhizobacter sp.]|jgi:hypothetical protein